MAGSTCCSSSACSRTWAACGRRSCSIIRPVRRHLRGCATVGPPVAERFELYADGIELANGYHELLDATILRERIAEANARRAADGKPTLPPESRLLAAMEAGLPPCTGVALGFDRLVMVAAGARTLAEVMSFPIDRA